MSTLSGMNSQTQTSFMTSVNAVLLDPSTSNSLRQRLHADLTRDPLDALNDAECLLELSQLRVKEVLSAHTCSPREEG